MDGECSRVSTGSGSDLGTHTSGVLGNELGDNSRARQRRAYRQNKNAAGSYEPTAPSLQMNNYSNRLAAADKSCEAPPSLSQGVSSAALPYALQLIGNSVPPKELPRSDVKRLPQSALQLQQKSLTRFTILCLFVAFCLSNECASKCPLRVTGLDPLRFRENSKVRVGRSDSCKTATMRTDCEVVIVRYRETEHLH